HAVDQHAIHAAQVLQHHALRIDHEAGVTAGDERIVDDNLAAITTPDDRDTRQELDVTAIGEAKPGAQVRAQRLAHSALEHRRLRGPRSIIHQTPRSWPAE